MARNGRYRGCRTTSYGSLSSQTFDTYRPRSDRPIRTSGHVPGANWGLTSTRGGLCDSLYSAWCQVRKHQPIPPPDHRSDYPALTRSQDNGRSRHPPGTASPCNTRSPSLAVALRAPDGARSALATPPDATGSPSTAARFLSGALRAQSCQSGAKPAPRQPACRRAWQARPSHAAAWYISAMRLNFSDRHASRHYDTPTDLGVLHPPHFRSTLRKW
jgi:hypothetical protein